MSAVPLSIIGEAISHLFTPTIAKQKTLYLIAWNKGSHAEVRVYDAELATKTAVALENASIPFVIYKLSPAAMAVKNRGRIVYKFFQPQIVLPLGINRKETI